MRIIAGIYKGRNLAEFKGKDIRPTGEKAREALFSILQTKIVGSEVLDLFAGTGAISFEALSRGAKNAVMSDISKESVNVINKNAALIKCNAEVYCTPALFMLNRLASAKRQFDVIFLDPPYRTPYGEEAIEIIVKKNLLKDDGIIILEKPSTEKADFSCEGVTMYDKRKYGLNSFRFYKKAEEK